MIHDESGWDITLAQRFQCTICGKFIAYDKITKRSNGCCYNDIPRGSENDQHW